MAAVDVIRAWKDAAYRESLAPEELASLPPILPASLS
jgi:mersacidin/lichenicidin family type 2 lantibiotic